MIECDFCESKFESEDRMETHMLLHHRDKLNSEDYDAPVSKGFLEEKEIPKGEQFGYRK